MLKKKWLIASLLVSVVALWGVHKFRNRDLAQLPDAIWVQASVVKESSLPQKAHAIGTLVARSVEITPEIAGHVDKILFQDGAFVKQGTVLIQLDDSIYKAKAESAKAKLDYFQNQFKRMTLLGKQGAIAQQMIDQSDADLKERKAEAKEADVMLNNMRLTAPFDGMVGKAKVSPGDYVTIGQSLVTITDTKHLRIEYNVSDKYLPLVKMGQDVKITTSAYPDKKFIGKVAYISPTINTENRSVSLYADIPNEDNILKPGMFVDAVQMLGTQERVLMIPSRSLVPILDGQQVYKIVDGKAQAVSITIGQRTRNDVEVLNGLTIGDQIITDGQLKVKNGMPVKIKT